MEEKRERSKKTAGISNTAAEIAALVVDFSIDRNEQIAALEAAAAILLANDSTNARIVLRQRRE